MHGPRHQHAPPPRQPLRHQHGFRRRRRAVVHGGVCDFLPRQLAHQRLKFENGLQRALRDFRLIRRVGSEKFAALDDGVRHHGAQMIVNACAQKTRVSVRILRRALLEILDHFGFRIRSGDLQRLAQAKTFRNAGKQFLDGFCADSGEHLLPLGRALREIAHQAEASLPLSAMYASYAAASIKPFSSLAFVSRALMSHAAPCGSVLSFSGVLCSSAFASSTSPEAGA